MKYKEDILHSKFDLEKKSYGKSMTELISRTLNFELLQELPESILIDINLNGIQLSQQNIEQLSQAIRKISKLRSLRFVFSFLFLSFFFPSFNSPTKYQINRIQRCSLSKENFRLIFQSLVNLKMNNCLQIIE